MQLKEGEGVCWAAIKQAETIIVPDVEKFPGHIACDSRSKSEIAMPLYNANKEIIGALDVDSSNYNNFDEIDAVELEKILNLIFV
jgi:GAF domain-containing protein